MQHQKGSRGRSPPPLLPMSEAELLQHQTALPNERRPTERLQRIPFH